MPETVILHIAVVSEPCDACGKPIKPGEETYTSIVDKYPWLQEDDDKQDFTILVWHKTCDSARSRRRLP